MWSLQLITAPIKEPLVLNQDVYKQLRIDVDPPAGPGPEDTLLQSMLQAARHNCETFTGRQLIDATWELWMDSWWEPGISNSCGDALLLPRPPLRSITSVKYVDTAGSLQTWDVANYSAETQLITSVTPSCQRGRLYPNYGIIWPDIRHQPGAVKIRFTCGHGVDDTKVPAGLKQGMLVEIAEMYERREILVVGNIVTPAVLTAEALWWPYRAW